MVSGLILFYVRRKLLRIRRMFIHNFTIREDQFRIKISNMYVVLGCLRVFRFETLQEGHIFSFFHAPNK